MARGASPEILIRRSFIVYAIEPVVTGENSLVMLQENMDECYCSPQLCYNGIIMLPR